MLLSLKCSSTIRVGGPIKLKPSKLDFFNKFKTKFMLEKYLICRDVDRPLRCAYSRFRVSAHSLLVEVGRYGKLKKRADRCCPFCTNTVENESHFLLECSQYDTLRLKYFSGISTCSTIDENFILSILQSMLLYRFYAIDLFCIYLESHSIGILLLLCQLSLCHVFLLLCCYVTHLC